MSSPTVLPLMFAPAGKVSPLFQHVPRSLRNRPNAPEIIKRELSCAQPRRPAIIRAEILNGLQPGIFVFPQGNTLKSTMVNGTAVYRQNVSAYGNGLHFSCHGFRGHAQE